MKLNSKTHFKHISTKWTIQLVRVNTTSGDGLYRDSEESRGSQRQNIHTLKWVWILISWGKPSSGTARSEFKVKFKVTNFQTWEFLQRIFRIIKQSCVPSNHPQKTRQYLAYPPETTSSRQSCLLECLRIQKVHRPRALGLVEAWCSYPTLTASLLPLGTKTHCKLHMKPGTLLTE